MAHETTASGVAGEFAEAAVGSPDYARNRKTTQSAIHRSTAELAYKDRDREPNHKRAE